MFYSINNNSNDLKFPQVILVKYILFKNYKNIRLLAMNITCSIMKILFFG